MPKVHEVSALTLDSGLTISYRSQGAVSDPTVVLIPGPTDSWRSYQPVLPAIPAHLRVVSVSLRGHGDSSKPTSGYSIEDLTSDVVPLLDALEIHRALLVGHSGSCLVARRVAIQVPTRVAGLVLEASPTTLRGDPIVNSVVSQLTEPIDRDFARSFVADTSTGDLAAELIELLVEDLLKVPVRAWQEMFASLFDYDDVSELPLVNAPTLLVWGDADPRVRCRTSLCAFCRVRSSSCTAALGTHLDGRSRCGSPETSRRSRRSCRGSRQDRERTCNAPDRRLNGTPGRSSSASSARVGSVRERSA
jgi:pimeloyl-ACP methyl ester carboxylesterase